jgi:hypothetical protein
MGIVRILIEVINTIGVEERRSSLNAVNLVSFGEEKLGEVRSVLAGNSCDQGFLQTMALLRAGVGSRASLSDSRDEAFEVALELLQHLLLA